MGGLAERLSIVSRIIRDDFTGKVVSRDPKEVRGL